MNVQSPLRPPKVPVSGLRNRLAAAVEAVMVGQRHRLVWVHAAMFLGFLAVIAVPAALPAQVGPRYGAVARYLLWGVWFPLVFLSVVFTGRSWCGLLCPMGAASEWTNRIGLRRPIPRWLRWEGTPIVSFLIVTVLGQTLGVRDHADGAAVLFGGTMAAALLVGFLYGRRKRAWCRHACPIGLLLGVFARLGAVDFEQRHGGRGRDEGYTERGVCPTMINLARKSESRHCIECFRCVNPKASGGMHVRLRRPGAEVEEIRRHHANAAEVWFLFLGTGAALGGFLWLALPQFDGWRQAIGEWAVAQGWTVLLTPGPSWLMSVHPAQHEVFLWLDFVMIAGFMLASSGLMAALLAPLTAVAALVARPRAAAGDRAGRFAGRFVALGYQYAPVAMVSLLIGLGGQLFAPLGAGAGAAKGALFMIGLIWSVWLDWRILAGEGTSLGRRALALLPGMVGSLAIGLGWWPAIFGL